MRIINSGRQHQRAQTALCDSSPAHPQVGMEGETMRRELNGSFLVLAIISMLAVAA